MPAVPTIVRLGKLVAFVGDERAGTRAGNLNAADAVAVERLQRIAKQTTLHAARVIYGLAFVA